MNNEIWTLEKDKPKILKFCMCFILRENTTSRINRNSENYQQYMYCSANHLLCKKPKDHFFLGGQCITRFQLILLYLSIWKLQTSQELENCPIEFLCLCNPPNTIMRPLWTLAECPAMSGVLNSEAGWITFHLIVLISYVWSSLKSRQDWCNGYGLGCVQPKYYNLLLWLCFFITPCTKC